MNDRRTRLDGTGWGGWRRAARLVSGEAVAVAQLSSTNRQRV